MSLNGKQPCVTNPLNPLNSERSTCFIVGNISECRRCGTGSSNWSWSWNRNWFAGYVELPLDSGWERQKTLITLSYVTFLYLSHQVSRTHLLPTAVAMGALGGRGSFCCCYCNFAVLFTFVLAVSPQFIAVLQQQQQPKLQSQMIQRDSQPPASPGGQTTTYATHSKFGDYIEKFLWFFLLLFATAQKRFFFAFVMCLCVLCNAHCFFCHCQHSCVCPRVLCLVIYQAPPYSPSSWLRLCWAQIALL